jgi:hypothetical protein
MHDDFECLSPRDYEDTMSWLAYEQNPYSTHGVRSKMLNRHVLESIGSQVMNLRVDEEISRTTIDVIYVKT